MQHTEWLKKMHQILTVYSTLKINWVFQILFHILINQFIMQYFSQCREILSTSKQRSYILLSRSKYWKSLLGLQTTNEELNCQIVFGKCKSSISRDCLLHNQNRFRRKLLVSARDFGKLKHESMSLIHQNPKKILSIILISLNKALLSQIVEPYTKKIIEVFNKMVNLSWFQPNVLCCLELLVK